MEGLLTNCSELEMERCDRVAEAAKAVGNIVRNVPKLLASSATGIDWDRICQASFTLRYRTKRATVR